MAPGRSARNGLYQAWAGSYQPVLRLLRELADEGRRDVLTLGVTPVLAAQLDDPYCLRGMHDWLGSWLLRSHEAAVRANGRWRDPAMATFAADEHRRAGAALDDFETRWRHGGSPVLRPLVDERVIELIGGPATHPFQPLLDPRVRAFALAAGLTDTERRLGSRPAGIWAPECGYAPGMEDGYAAGRGATVPGRRAGVRGDTAFARTVGESDVVCFGRDLPVTYRVWSPRSVYPGRAEYRDFHTYDHSSGLKPSRVTGRRVPSERKKPYDPELATKAVRRDAADFVKVVRDRLRVLAHEHGRPTLVVAAYDTELFGHWWYEGRSGWARCSGRSTEAGVRVSTLGGALEAGLLGGTVALPASSWGSGKDWRVWGTANWSRRSSRPAAASRTGYWARSTDHRPAPGATGCSTGWPARRCWPCPVTGAFMVTKDSAADYALARAHSHASEVAALAALISAGKHDRAARMVAELDGREPCSVGWMPGRWTRQCDFRHASQSTFRLSSVLSGR